jgi:hypothetical protein
MGSEVANFRHCTMRHDKESRTWDESGDDFQKCPKRGEESAAPWARRLSVFGSAGAESRKSGGPETHFRNHTHHRQERRRAPHHLARAQSIFEKEKQSKAQNMGSEGFIFGECTNLRVCDEEEEHKTRIARSIYTPQRRASLGDGGERSCAMMLVILEHASVLWAIFERQARRKHRVPPKPF